MLGLIHTILDPRWRVLLKFGRQVRARHIESAIHIAGRNGAAVSLGVACRHHYCDLRAGLGCFSQEFFAVSCTSAHHAKEPCVGR